jgi:hypothetical protein
MQKTQKALAIKKLQTELKEEKRAEFQRYFIFLLITLFFSSFKLGARRSLCSAKKQQKRGSGLRKTKPRYILLSSNFCINLPSLAIDGS